MQLEVAAAQLEKIERVVEKFFRGGARGKRPVVARAGASGQLGDAARDVGARKRILQIKLDDRGKAQLEPVAVILGKLATQGLIEDETRFEIGASELVFKRAAA